MNLFAELWHGKLLRAYRQARWIDRPIHKIKLLLEMHWLRQRTEQTCDIHAWVMQVVLPEALRAKRCEWLAVAFESGVDSSQLGNAYNVVCMAIPEPTGYLCPALQAALLYLDGWEYGIVRRAARGLDQGAFLSAARWVVQGGVAVPVVR